MEGKAQNNLNEDRRATGKVIDLRGLTRFPSNSTEARGMDAMIDLDADEVPWLDQPELGKRFREAMTSRGYHTRKALAEAIWDRYGEVSNTLDSMTTVFSNILNGKVSSGNYLLFAEAVLGVPLNTTGEVWPYGAVEKVAQKSVRRVKEGRETGEYMDHNKKVSVVKPQRFQHVHDSVTEVIDTPLQREHLTTQGRRVFDTMDGSGGAMLLIESAASIEAIVPTQLSEVPEAYGVRVTGNSLSGIVKDGSIVWVDPHIEANEPSLVLLVPVDESDVRRYVRLLLQITSTDFIAWQTTPPESKPFARDQWRCLLISDVTGIKAGDS